MKIHATMSGSKANGPGIRSCVWVQGCSLACPKCHNPLTHDPNGALGEDFDPDELAEKIIRDMAPGTTGLTISGGEPMEQGLSVYAFMCSIEARRPGLDIGMFTGYTLSELMMGDYRHPDLIHGSKYFTQQDRRRLLWEHQVQRKLTWAIMGRYDSARTSPADRADIPWRHCVSSANQDLRLFRRRWTYADFPALSLEVSIDETGLTQISGFPI